MKKSVAHLIPFMEKERQDRLEQRAAEGIEEEEEEEVRSWRNGKPTRNLTKWQIW